MAMGHPFGYFSRDSKPCMFASMQRQMERPATRKKAVATGRARDARRSLSVNLVRYRLRVSKPDPTFPEFLAEAIKRAGFATPTDFARAAGIHPSVASRWLKGERPTLRLLERVAPTLHVPVQRLVSIAYPGEVQPDEVPAKPAPHALALELERLLAEDSPVPAMDRDTLERVIDSVLQPYRRHLKGRRRAA
jgi:transcriptional regulator with XRE-family HTH domain